MADYLGAVECFTGSPSHLFIAHVANLLSQTLFHLLCPSAVLLALLLPLNLLLLSRSQSLSPCLQLAYLHVCVCVVQKQSCQNLLCV